MPGIIEFPKVVRDVVEEFHDLFASEPPRWHFAKYLTGLMVAEQKAVLGIRDQSCRNRFLIAVEGGVEAFGER
ncbi:MAG: hypothetical protein LC104_22120 [Bacteroidales bacterium]|nr:hypothetical protein [Bacteroidales bacterium]